MHICVCSLIPVRGVHNTVADAIRRLYYNPEVNPPWSSHHLQRLSDEHDVKVKHLEMEALSGKIHSTTKLVATRRVENNTIALVNIN